MKLSHVVVTALIACGLAFAQETTTPPAGGGQGTEKAPATKKAAVKSVTGTLVSVDAIANTIVIKTKKAEDTITVNDKTTYTAKGKSITLSDLKTGSRVTVHYMIEEGKMVASKVMELGQVKAKKSDSTSSTGGGTTAPK